jgi:Tfp pilus assembly protein PilF
VSNRFIQQEIETHEALLSRAADVVEQLGMPTAAEHVRWQIESKAMEYLEMAIEAGVEAEKEKMAIQFAIRRRLERMEDQIAYQIALASVGTSGWTTQGFRTFYG